MLDFKDFIVADYRPGEPDIIKYRAQRRRHIGESNASWANSHVDEQSTPYYNKASFIKKMSQMAKRERLERERKQKEQQKSKTEEAEPVDEALTVSQRLARKRQMMRTKAKIKLGRERAKRRFASKEKLEKRAIRQARMKIFKKLTKDIPKDELTYARRAEIEKRLEKPALKQRIKMIARRMFPQVRKQEIERKRRQASS